MAASTSMIAQSIEYLSHYQIQLIRTDILLPIREIRDLSNHGAAAMHGSDIMTTSVVSVAPDAPIDRVIATLLENRISAVPVVEHGAVIGIVTEGDLLRRAEIGTERKRSRWLELSTASQNLAAEYVKTHGRTARDVMTAPVISVAADTAVAKIAEIMESRHIKRVPVVHDGTLVGIDSRANIIQAVATMEWTGVVPRPSVGDDKHGSQ